MEDAIVQSGGTAGLVAALWGIVHAIKTHRAKQNGGTTYTRVALLESKIDDLSEEVNKAVKKLTQAHRDLCEFREDFRIQSAKAETREEMRRERGK